MRPYVCLAITNAGLNFQCVRLRSLAKVAELEPMLDRPLRKVLSCRENDLPVEFDAKYSLNTD